MAKSKLGGKRGGKESLNGLKNKKGGTINVRTIGKLSDFMKADDFASNVAGNDRKKRNIGKMFEESYGNLPVIGEIPKGAIAVEIGRSFRDKNYDTFSLYRSGSMFDPTTIKFLVRKKATTDFKKRAKSIDAERAKRAKKDKQT